MRSGSECASPPISAASDPGLRMSEPQQCIAISWRRQERCRLTGFHRVAGGLVCAQHSRWGHRHLIETADEKQIERQRRVTEGE